MKVTRAVRLSILAIVGLLPGLLKRPLYRLLFGYQIASGVHIGFSLLDARALSIAEGGSIGSFNLLLSLGALEMGPGARIESFNVLRGGERIVLGPRSTVMRFNLLNAIPDHDCTTTPTSELTLGEGACVTAEHRIDFTDRVTLGRNVILGGRNSSLWTHDRQETQPIHIEDFCYLGSEIRIAPGGRLPTESILGLGAVLTNVLDEPGILAAGVPARKVRPLSPTERARLHNPTRREQRRPQ